MRTCWLTLGCARCSRSAARRKCSSSATHDERAQLAELHRLHDRRCLSQARESVLIARAPRSYGRAHVEREPRHGCPCHGDVARSSGRSTSRTRSASTRAPAPSSRCSSARSSATGSSRATTTSTRSSRTRRRSRSENTQAPYKPRPPEVAARSSTRASFTRLLRALRPPAARPHAAARLHQEGVHAAPGRRARAADPRARRRAMIDELRATRGRCRPRRRAHATSCPALVIFRLLGVPDEDVPRVKEWAASRVVAELRRPRRSTSRSSTRSNLVALLALLPASSSTRASSDPRDDLPVRPRPHLPRRRPVADDRRDGRPRLRAAHRGPRDDVSSLLARRPQGAARAARALGGALRRPVLIPTAVEELLRLVTPVFAWKRARRSSRRASATSTSPRAPTLLLLLGSANHDETVVRATPRRSTCTATNARNHLAFGHGIHFCLGAPLARLEAQVVLEELTARLPGCELVGGPGVRLPAEHDVPRADEVGRVATPAVVLDRPLEALRRRRSAARRRAWHDAAGRLPVAEVRRDDARYRERWRPVAGGSRRAAR